MKRSALLNPKVSERPLAEHGGKSAARRVNAEDTYDDRVSESIFDIEDERAEVDIIVHGMSRDAN